MLRSKKEEKTLSILERLEQCVKDENGQPLICYKCSHSAAYCEMYGTGNVVEGTDFPGMPSGERPCFFCIRNSKREDWAKENNIDKWYDQSEPLKVPMDCYHSTDMLQQYDEWLQKSMGSARDEVKKFAEAMEAELKENDHKGGWKRCKPEFLIAKLTEEVKELYEASKKMDENKYNYSITEEELTKLKKEVLSEAADVANIVMMIADVWGAL